MSSVVSAYEGNYVAEEPNIWNKATSTGAFSFTNADVDYESRYVWQTCDLMEISPKYESWGGYNYNGNVVASGARCDVGQYIVFWAASSPNGDYFPIFADAWYKSTEGDLVKFSNHQFTRDLGHFYYYYICYDCENQYQTPTNPDYTYLGQDKCSPDGSYICHEAYDYNGQFYCDDYYKKDCGLGCENGVCSNPTPSSQYQCDDDNLMVMGTGTSADIIQLCQNTGQVCAEYPGNDPSAMCVNADTCDDFDLPGDKYSVDGECEISGAMKCQDNIAYECQQKSGLNCWISVENCGETYGCQVNSQEAACYKIQNCEGTSGECSWFDEFIDINGKCSADRREILKCQNGCWIKDKACLASQKCVNSKCMDEQEANQLLEDAGIDPEYSDDGVTTEDFQDPSVKLLYIFGSVFVILVIVIGLVLIISYFIKKRR